ncbi:MAG: hypothetical protein Q4F05_02505 [bacterium]|nr:hypothetical protein [bacterium]
MKQIKDTMLNVRLTKELVKEFKIACLVSDRKQSSVIEELLVAFIENQRKEDGGF